MGLGVGCGKAAALVASACDRTTEHSACFVVEARAGECLLGVCQMASVDVGDEKVLPDGEADFTGAETVCNLGYGAHLVNWQATDWDREADVVEAGL